MNDVYPPSEDTFLLIDSINDMPYVRKALEVGSGSGAVSVVLTYKADYVVATDIDLNSCYATLERLRKHDRRASTDVVCCDLLSAFRGGSGFDLIVFNPPYLPDECLKDVAVFGGNSGVETSVDFLHQAHHVLSQSGRILLVTSSVSDLGKLWKAASELKLNHRTLRSVKLFFEEINVVEFKKSVNKKS
ncbi:MAG: methyltransferase [Nitrososphaerota archaeon]|nr:methyltransferase [Aigarchaeota archaeon]MDW8076777.1 methyltransferase [Nitrososphaerota archaeon]